MPSTLSGQVNLPKSRDGSAGHHVGDALRARLQRTTEEKDDSADEDGPFPAQTVSRRGSAERTEKSTAGENRDDSTDLSGIIAELVGEVLGGNDLGNDAQIVTVGEGAQGGKHTDQPLVKLGRDSHGDDELIGDVEDGELRPERVGKVDGEGTYSKTPSPSRIAPWDQWICPLGSSPSLSRGHAVAKSIFPGHRCGVCGGKCQSHVVVFRGASLTWA